MDFIIRAEDTHARNSIANPAEIDEPPPTRHISHLSSSKLGPRQQQHTVPPGIAPDLVRGVETAVEPLDKGKGKEVDSGRTLKRKLVFPNPFATAESRVHEHKATIDVDGDPIQSGPSSQRRESMRGPSTDFGPLHRRSTSRSSTLFEVRQTCKFLIKIMSE